MSEKIHKRLVWFVLVTFLMAIAVLISTVLSAQADVVFKYLPCDPLLLAGPQGRPIPNATVMVTNPDGSQVTNGVWLNYTGTVPFDNRIPADQVLQVYADPGIYRVFTSGAGITKTYYIRCGTGLGEGVRTISIDRTADVLLTNATSPPALACDVGTDCYLVYDAQSRQTAFLDFITPSFPITLDSLLISWTVDVLSQSNFNVVWVFKWCTYAVGETPCNIEAAANVFTVVPDVVLNQLTKRMDTTVLGSAFSTNWPPNSHVLLSVTHDGLDFRDIGHTFSGEMDLHNIRLEFLR